MIRERVPRSSNGPQECEKLRHVFAKLEPFGFQVSPAECPAHSCGSNEWGVVFKHKRIHPNGDLTVIHFHLFQRRRLTHSATCLGAALVSKHENGRLVWPAVCVLGRCVRAS